MEMHLALLFTGRCGESKPPVHPFHLLAHMGSTELQLLGELTGEPKKTVIVAKGDLGDMETVATQRRTKAPARLVFTTERNRLGLAEANGTLASVFRDGFEPRNLFSTLALIIGQLYARVDRPITRKTAAVTPDMLREAMHYHRWSTAPYGSLLLAHQTGRNWLQDCYRFGSDELAAAEFLGLADNDMLLFHRDSNNFYDPTYLIALDRITGMLVLSARGTLDVMSGLTDLASDVCLFRDGAAHLGWLRSSMLVYNRELARVLRWVEAYRPRGLVVCGHSYGAAVASLLCILFTDHVEELRALSGRVDFDVRAFTYGCPPTVSPAIAAQFVGAIHSYQHENDNVCSLSMGALYDMRDLVALADSHLARGTPKEETLRDLERLRRSLLETGRYPRLEVPGRVVYLYQDPGKPLHNRLEDRSYLAEESLASCFHELIPKALVEPHFPRSYAAALAKALEAAEGTGYGTGGRKSRTTREWWRDPYEDRLKVMRQVERMEVPAAGKIDPATGLCDCTGCIKDRERA
ncbi:Alpha/Beta hydrolase protein [Hyaloraphidium curvatum]|nr:Alpha/Beta hydrolase protein [Hyaloraphidium curvatum]